MEVTCSPVCQSSPAMIICPSSRGVEIDQVVRAGDGAECPGHGPVGVEPAGFERLGVGVPPEPLRTAWTFAGVADRRERVCIACAS